MSDSLVDQLVKALPCIPDCRDVKYRHTPECAPYRQKAAQKLMQGPLRDVKGQTLRDAASALKEYAERMFHRDDSPFHVEQRFALTHTAVTCLRARAASAARIARAEDTPGGDPR